VPLRGATLGCSLFRRSSFGSAPLGRAPFGHSLLGRAPLGHSLLGHSPLRCSSLGTSLSGIVDGRGGCARRRGERRGREDDQRARREHLVELVGPEQAEETDRGIGSDQLAGTFGDARLLTGRRASLHGGVLEH